MRNIFSALIFLLILPVQSRPQNNGKHLKPVNGIFGIHNFQFEYYSKIRKVLLRDLSDSPVIRFLVIPSFSPEKVVDIEYDAANKKYYLVHQICKEMIWHNETWQKVKTKRYKTEMDKNSVKIIKSLFKKALNQTKFPKKETMVLDGINYFFFYNDYGLKVGTVWSPPKGSPMKELVDIGNQLITFSGEEKSIITFEKKFIKQIQDLIKTLKE